MTSGHGKRRCHDPGTVIATAVTPLGRSLDVRFVVPRGGFSRASPLPLGGGGGGGAASQLEGQGHGIRALGFQSGQECGPSRGEGPRLGPLVAAAAQPGEPLNRPTVGTRQLLRGGSARDGRQGSRRRGRPAEEASEIFAKFHANSWKC